MTKMCPNCRKTYTDFSLNFCLEDGTRLIEEAAGASQPTLVFPPPVTIAQTDAPNFRMKTNSKTKFLVIIGAALAVFVLATGVLGLIFLRNGQSPTERRATANNSENIANAETSQNFKDGKSANANNSKSPFESCSLPEADSIEARKISFAPGSFGLLPESVEILKNISAHLKNLPDNCFVEIGVHTDNAGDVTANTNLSMNRCFAIEKFFVERGVDKSKLSWNAYGSSQPIDTNSTEEGRKRNRRVEFKLFTRDELKDAGSTSDAEYLDLSDPRELDKLKSDRLTVISQNPLAPEKPNPLTLVVIISPNGDLVLNNEIMGNASGANILSKKLGEIFKTREEMKIFREGANAVEKTVTIKSPSRIDRRVFDSTLKLIEAAGASPVNLYFEK